MSEHTFSCCTKELRNGVKIHYIIMDGKRIRLCDEHYIPIRKAIEGILFKE